MPSHVLAPHIHRFGVISSFRRGGGGGYTRQDRLLGRTEALRLLVPLFRLPEVDGSARLKRKAAREEKKIIEREANGAAATTEG